MSVSVHKKWKISIDKIWTRSEKINRHKSNKLKKTIQKSRNNMKMKKLRSMMTKIQLLKWIKRKWLSCRRLILKIENCNTQKICRIKDSCMKISNQIFESSFKKEFKSLIQLNKFLSLREISTLWYPKLAKQTKETSSAVKMSFLVVRKKQMRSVARSKKEKWRSNKGEESCNKKQKRSNRENKRLKWITNVKKMKSQQIQIELNQIILKTSD